MVRIRVLSVVLIAVMVAGIPAQADNAASLKAVRGTVGYETSKDGPFSRVFGSFLVQDNQFAVTQAASNGLLALADSSEIALGENTTIQVGALTQAASAAAPTAVTLVSGTVRFAIKHPAGQQSNYRFQTSTSQLAVRGTVGLYSSGPNGDVISCLDCAAGDVTVSAGGQSFPLLTGQTASISLAGVVTIAATTAIVATTFSSAGLSTSATSAGPFAPGVGTAGAAGGAGGAAAGAGIGTASAVAAGAIAATAIGVTAASNNSTPAPSQSNGPNTNANPTPTPSPTAAPTQGGAINISSHNHAAAPAAAAPPVAAPLPAPPPPSLGTSTEHRPR
jgi:hypothetical protein